MDEPIIIDHKIERLYNAAQLLYEQIRLEREILSVLRRIASTLTSNVTGGTMSQTGNTMQPIQPGNSPKFQVTPTFSGAPFPLDGANAAVSTSDPVNAPAALDLTDDPTGATFVLNLTADAVIAAGGEPIIVTWTYTNVDGTVATVTGTVTEEGIVDDVTGGTFTQIA
jgi:hypothetical protein